MTARELIEKLEHVTEHRLETEVKFWVDVQSHYPEEDGSGNYEIREIEHVGDYVCIYLK